MAFYTRNEFALFLGIDKNPRQIIKTNIDRGKIIENEDGLIDDTVPANAEFKRKYLEIRKQKVGLPIVKKEASTIIESPIAVQAVATNKKVQKAAAQATISKFDLEIKKTEADIEKKLIDTELARVKLSVLQGGNLPISLVKSIVSTLGKSILSNYKSFQDQLITEFCHEHGISNADRTKALSKAVAGLNGIHTKAITDAGIQLKNAIGATKTQLANEDDEE